MNRFFCIVLACLFQFLTPLAHAQTNWSFTIETPNISINPTESFSVLGKITNFATSTSVLSIREPSQMLITPFTFWLGAEDSTPFDLFAVDTSPIYATLPGLHLNPGESLSFIAYTASPRNGAVAPGTYNFVVNDLSIPEYGFSYGGPVHIAVVPEPASSVMLILGMVLLGFTVNARKFGA